MTSSAWGLLALFLAALLVVLGLSIFPLIVSLYLSLSRLQFTRDGIDIRFSREPLERLQPLAVVEGDEGFPKVEHDRLDGLHHSTSSSRGLSRRWRPTFPDGRPSVITTSAVKSSAPRIREEPTP